MRRVDDIEASVFVLGTEILVCGEDEREYRSDEGYGEVHVVFVASDDRDPDVNSLHGVALRFSHSIA